MLLRAVKLKVRAFYLKIESARAPTVVQFTVWRVEYVKAMKTSKSTGEDGPDGRKRIYTGAAEKYTGAAEIHTYDISEGAVVSTLAISPNVVAFATATRWM